MSNVTTHPKLIPGEQALALAISEALRVLRPPTQEEWAARRAEHPKPDPIAAKKQRKNRDGEYSHRQCQAPKR